MGQKDRREYLTAGTLDQTLLDRLSDGLENKLEMVADITTPTGILRVSDRNKYVGSDFYPKRVSFPQINKTVGLWLSNTLEFPTIRLDIDNVDGLYNNFLPAGADFDGWIGKSVVIRLGLADKVATYDRIFEGFISEVAGFGRTTRTIRIIARDKFGTINKSFPNTVLTEATYPKIELDKIGVVVPVIYGDWTDEASLRPDPAAIIAIPVNSGDPEVNGDSRGVEFDSTGDIVKLVRHLYDDNDPIKFLNSSIPEVVDGTPYFVRNPNPDDFQLATTPGGVPFTLTDGEGNAETNIAQRKNIEFKISDQTLQELKSGENDIWLKRSDLFFNIAAADITAISGAKNSFEIIQGPAGSTLIEGGDFNLISSDEFVVKVKGPALTGGRDSNAVEIAKDILIVYGDVIGGDFDANWTTFATKASGTISQNIVDLKTRLWIQDPKGALEVANSLLEQIRLETFVVRETLDLKLNSLHFDDFDASPSLSVKDWDIKRDTFNIKIDDRNNFNRAQAVYNFLPVRKEQANKTSVFRNSAAITQVGRAISKRINFPNLYEETQVEQILKDFIRLASGYMEILQTEVSWRFMLVDPGDFVKLNVKIGSSQFTDVPAMIRDVGFLPRTLSRPLKLWSFQMIPFPGHAPGFSGIVGGSTAVITEE